MLRPALLLPVLALGACGDPVTESSDTAALAPFARTRSGDLEVTLTLDAAVYSARASTIQCITTPCPSDAGPAFARPSLTVQNVSDHAVHLALPSAQRFDLEVLDEAGDVVTTWSMDRLFAARASEVTLAPGQREDWVTELDLGTYPGPHTVRATVAGTDVVVDVPVRIELTGSR